jgi:hypothetical protein
MEKEPASRMNGRPPAWLWIFGFLSAATLLAAAILPPIPQPVEYHQFADRRIFFSIPNFFNVASNLALLYSGMAGLIFLLRSPATLNHGTFIQLSERWPYIFLFLSVTMTCFGSVYYHWVPDNERLLWDRLPIATGITALLAATLVERVSTKVGLRFLPWLMLVGVSSVLYWYWSEQTGTGNLNFYIVTQFYSLLLIIMLGLLLPSRYTHGAVMYWVVGLYGIAKIVESLDREIYALGGVISGHTLKHLFAALAIYWILKMLQKRSPVPKLR